MDHKKGKLIVFEGIEGSGKTTQVSMLADRMKKGGFSVLSTREPTSEFKFGKLARAIYAAESLQETVRGELKNLFQAEEYYSMKKAAHNDKLIHVNRFENIAEELLKNPVEDVVSLLQIAITLDRHDHIIEMIRPALNGGTFVLSDRYFASTPAYSSANGADWRPFLKMQYEILGKEFIFPDLMVVLDIPVDTGIERTLTKQRDKREYFDTVKRQEKIQRAYHEIIADQAVKEKIKIFEVDGGLSPETIHNRIWDETQTILTGENK